MNKIIQKVEAKYLKDEVPEVNVGDSVKANLKVVEGDKERIQTFQGLVIAKSGRGINKSLTIRKLSFGIGVERKVLLHSPTLAGIEIVKKGKPRRAKLYYLRQREGKSALKVKQA